MIGLFYGVAAVALVWWLSQWFARQNPAALAKALKAVGGVIALGGAALMLLRGRIDMAFVLGGVSRVRSAMIEMELDHDTGDMSGAVLAGLQAGRALNDLDEDALRALHAACGQADPDGARLLEAYLDRRFPRWREHAQAHQDPGPDARPHAGAMTEEEAYQILGLRPGASPDDVRRAHRALMKKLHPDQGGSTYLAAKVNQAKEILLTRHR
jgi:DnaJ-domain-containing protein 1